MPRQNTVSWTLEENEALLRLVTEEVDDRGRPRWAMVAKGLPGRTAQEARCRWRRISDAQNRRERGDKTCFRNKCHACGQFRRGHVCTAMSDAKQRQVATLVKVTTEKGKKEPAKSSLACSSKKEPPTASKQPSIVNLDDCEDVLPALPSMIQRGPSVIEMPQMTDCEDVFAPAIPLFLQRGPSVFQEIAHGAAKDEVQLKRLVSLNGCLPLFEAFYTESPEPWL